MRRKQVRKAMKNMTSRERARFSRDFSRAKARSPLRMVVIICLVLLLLFFFAPYFF